MVLQGDVGVLSIHGHVLLRQVLESSHVSQPFGREVACGVHLLGHCVVQGSLSQVVFDQLYIPIDVGMFGDVVDGTIEAVGKLWTGVHGGASSCLSTCDHEGQ